MSVQTRSCYNVGPADFNKCRSCVLKEMCEPAVSLFIPKTSALERQEGGDHYTKLKIQPMEYSMANKLDACQHTAIKYITRFRDKGGVQDLEKAKHVIDLLIEFERRAQS